MIKIKIFTNDTWHPPMPLQNIPPLKGTPTHLSLPGIAGPPPHKHELVMPQTGNKGSTTVKCFPALKWCAPLYPIGTSRSLVRNILQLSGGRGGICKNFVLRMVLTYEPKSQPPPRPQTFFPPP